MQSRPSGVTRDRLEIILSNLDRLQPIGTSAGEVRAGGKESYW